MPDECQDEVRPECQAKLDAIHEEVTLIRQAVIGNGGKGLKDTVAAHGMALKIIGAATAIIAGAVLAAALAGCAGISPAPAHSARPVAAAAPASDQRVVAEAIERLEQNLTSQITQVQTTVQTTSFALDEQRAQVERAALRKQEKQATQNSAILVGVLIMMGVAPAFLPKRWQWLGYLAGLGIVAGAVGIPLLWPF